MYVRMLLHILSLLLLMLLFFFFCVCVCVVATHTPLSNKKKTWQARMKSSPPQLSPIDGHTHTDVCMDVGQERYTGSAAYDVGGPREDADADDAHGDLDYSHSRDNSSSNSSSCSHHEEEEEEDYDRCFGPVVSSSAFYYDEAPIPVETTPSVLCGSAQPQPRSPAAQAPVSSPSSESASAVPHSEPGAMPVNDTAEHNRDVHEGNNQPYLLPRDSLSSAGAAAASSITLDANTNAQQSVRSEPAANSGNSVTTPFRNFRFPPASPSTSPSPSSSVHDDENAHEQEHDDVQNDQSNAKKKDTVMNSVANTSSAAAAAVRVVPGAQEQRCHVAAAPPITMRMPTAAVHSGLLPTYKILVVGDAGVGKTNLLSRYCTERYDPTAPPTLGVEFFSRELDVPSGPVGQVDTVVVQLWDTAGQERSSMISTAFFRNAVGAILVYDVSRRDTLLNVPKWAAHVRAVASEDCVCFVVGNKYDLCDESAPEHTDATPTTTATAAAAAAPENYGRYSFQDTAASVPMQTVDLAEAEEIAHSLDMRLFLTSAKRGDGVLGAFTSMVLSVNAVQSVKKNHTITDVPAADSADKSGPAKRSARQRRKSTLDLRGFGSGGEGVGSGCAC